MGIIQLLDKMHDFYIFLLHLLAMNIPSGRIKRICYHLRGSNIGKNVDIASGVFMEEIFAHFISIEDNVDIGPNVIIVTHDSSYHCLDPEIPIICREVKIKKNAYIGAGAIILPGVTIGEYSVVGAGAVITKDVEPYTIVAGVPGKKIGDVKSRFDKYIGNNKEYKDPYRRG